MSDNEEHFAKLLPAIIEQEATGGDRRETSENLKAANKLASRLRAANVDLPPEVWQAIEEGRTLDFQNHPDFMLALRAMTVGGWRAKTGPSEGILFNQTSRYVKLLQDDSQTGDGKDGIELRLPCEICRGLHGGDCLQSRETRWQRFRSILVRLWRRVFGKIKVGPWLSRRQRALLPGTNPSKRQSFPKDYDGAAEAKIAEEIGADRIDADPACVGPVEIDKR